MDKARNIAVCAFFIVIREPGGNVPFFSSADPLPQFLSVYYLLSIVNYCLLLIIVCYYNSAIYYFQQTVMCFKFISNRACVASFFFLIALRNVRFATALLFFV